MPYLRLRQACLVAADLAGAEADLSAVLGLPVHYRDPGVANYGLENAIFSAGPTFIEIVSPLPGREPQATAAGRFLERRGGVSGNGGGYVVLMDCDDVPRRVEHMAAIGVRIAHELKFKRFHAIQLHPRDAEACMIELDCTLGGEPLDGPFFPAGRGWPEQAPPSAVRLVAAELSHPDPAALAARWGEMLERPVTAGEQLEIALDMGCLRFVHGETAAFSGIDLAAADPHAILGRARQQGLAADGDSFTFCNLTVRVIGADPASVAWPTS